MNERTRKELKYIIFATMKKIEGLKVLEEGCQQKGIRLYYSLPEEETLICETLYITDCAEICRQLLAENANVLVWLHEENRQEDFDKAGYAIERIEEMDADYGERIYQRFQKLPWKITETKRCIIREMKEEDLEEVYQIYAADSITKYMEGLYEDREKELEYTRSYIQNMYTFWGYGIWIIERKSDHKIIGRVGFDTRDEYAEPELGFVIMEREQQKGYAYECCRAVLKTGKEDYEFEAVQALVQKENKASLNLCHKLGFELKEKIVTDGKEYFRFILKL